MILLSTAMLMISVHPRNKNLREISANFNAFYRTGWCTPEQKT